MGLGFFPKVVIISPLIPTSKNPYIRLSPFIHLIEFERRGYCDQELPRTPLTLLSWKNIPFPLFFSLYTLTGHYKLAISPLESPLPSADRISGGIRPALKIFFYLFDEVFSLR